MQTRDFTFVHKYFIAEKQESLLFLLVGIVAVTLSLLFFFVMKSNPSFNKGAAIPLILVGLIQIVVGYTVYVRSDKQRMDVAYKIGMEPVSFIKNEELPRMQTVNKNFVIYRYTEIALAIAGIVLILLFRKEPDKAFWFGLGVTLAIQSVIMLGADYFAEKRALLYTGQLQSLLK
jgi:predicted membrane channel-forming protein YqfA (hemolysin III family)